MVVRQQVGADPRAKNRDPPIFDQSSQFLLRLGAVHAISHRRTGRCDWLIKAPPTIFVLDRGKVLARWRKFGGSKDRSVSARIEAACTSSGISIHTGPRRP